MSGYSIIDLGPSGAGKSSLCRDALLHEGSGVVLLAPGDAERVSYLEFEDNDAYQIGSFDDSEFFPTVGEWEATGQKNAVTALRNVASVLKKDREEGKPLRWRVLVLDSLSSFSHLSVNAMMAAMRLDDAPKAMSPEGARYYSGIRNKTEEVLRAARVCQGFGMHLLCTTHVTEKEQKLGTGLATQISKTVHVPLMAGSIRDTVTQMFDLAVYAGIDTANELVDGRNDPARPRFYVQWVPDPKRPTKWRGGVLSATDKLPNDWRVLRDAIEASLATRSQREAPSQTDASQSAQSAT